ncbi:MAG: flavodoxin domain-containing protein [Candidatus Pacearchaeota archaeon]|jgi:flavodoxin
MKVLILYYSRTGNTKNIAQLLSKELKADIEEIIDEKSRLGTLGYLTASLSAILKSNTKINKLKKNPKNYDIVIIGSPVWMGSVSPAIRTYLKNNSTNLKKVVLFCSMGSRPSKIFHEMSKIIGKKPLSVMSFNSKEINDKLLKEKIKDFSEEIKQLAKVKQINLNILIP